jgi:membrane fusion protein, heavy metal efflux system
MKMENIRSLVLIVSVILVFLTSCGKHKTVNEAPKTETVSDMVSLSDEQVKMSEIKTGSIEMRQVNNTLKLNGEITSLPQNTASVSMPMGGRVRSIYVLPGSKVTKGQVLAYVENEEFIDLQQNYLETKNKIDYLSVEYQRQRTLYTNDASSKKTLQQTASEYRTLKIQLRGYEQKLLLIGVNPYRLSSGSITRAVAVKSPISGFVKAVNTSVGSTVAETEDLFDVVNTDHLYIRLTVFEKDIDRLHKGQQLIFFVNDEAETHQAVVYQTTKSIDSDKSYKVYARIVSRCDNVLPGMYVNAEVMLDGAKLPALPDEAVVSYGGKDYIFVFKGTESNRNSHANEYKMVEIRKGASNGGYIHVILPSGIPTDKIVVKGTYHLLSALKNAGEED